MNGPSTCHGGVVGWPGPGLLFIHFGGPSY